MIAPVGTPSVPRTLSSFALNVRTEKDDDKREDADGQSKEEAEEAIVMCVRRKNASEFDF